MPPHFNTIDPAGIAARPENWQIGLIHYQAPIMKNSAVLLTLSLLSVTLPLRADELADAKVLASQLVQRLGATLKQEMSTHGPEGAVGVCRDVAPSIASELYRQSGGKVARVSLKTRNPLLGAPDGWEQQVLLEFDRRVAAGEKPEALEYSETVSEPNGRYLRYMKALPVQPLCLSCHGTSENIPDGVKAKLAADYPHDRATGYLAGSVRGAVSVKLPAGGTP